MTARRVLRRTVAAGALLFGAALATGVYLLAREDEPATGPTVGEKIATLVTDRASLQARADGEARIALLPAYRVASLLTDALVARSDGEEERAFDRLPAFRLKAFAELDALNAALADSLARPGDGARRAASKAAERATGELDRLAGLDNAPLVLSFTPRFVPPRRAAGELTLSPGASSARPQDDALRLGSHAGGRRLARYGHRGAGPAALCRAAWGVHHRRRAHRLCGGYPVGSEP